MAYIGQTLTEGTRRVYTYTATASQSTFNAVYNVGQVDVHQNGILLQPADFTASTGTTIVLGTAAALNDEITITCHNTFSVADTVSSSQGGTFAGAITAANGLTVDDDGATPLTVDRATSDGTIIDVQKDGTSVGNIGANGSRAYMSGPQKGIKFGNASVDPCTNTGATADNAYDLGGSSIRFKDLYLGGGIYLGGTGAANKLDDYETGTWTPTLLDGANASQAITSVTAEYTKIGNTVFVYTIFTRNNTTGTNGILNIGGLPFSAVAGKIFLTGHMWIDLGGPSNGDEVAAAYNGGGLTIYGVKSTTSSQQADTRYIQYQQLSNGRYVYMSLQYRVA